MNSRVTVIGGGLAGCEAALDLACAGVGVRLYEMKPQRMGPAHKATHLAELVCSNSLRSDNPQNAIGLLHEELRRLGSPVLAAADRHRVPAGDALAVDRTAFGLALTRAVEEEPLVELVREEATRLPDGPAPCVVATGPLTSDALAAELAEAAGRGALAFYDAIAPIVAADSVDLGVAFAQSRYGKGGGEDYLNLPFTREEYQAFVSALRAGIQVAPHAFEEPRYFEGCLPLEVMAERGVETLAHGPLKPVGLRDPRTGRQPWAVAQLRREDRAGTSYNLVGFQTRLTWPEQKRIFRAFIPGLENAEFLRLGQVHRNTFLDAPAVLGPDLSLRARPHLFFAGQISGVEGYVESAASGWLAARLAMARLTGRPWIPPPATTALGALYRHVTGEAHPPGYAYQPSNVIWGLFPPPEGRVPKALRKERMLERARADLSAWIAAGGERSSPAPAAHLREQAAKQPLASAVQGESPGPGTEAVA